MTTTIDQVKPGTKWEFDADVTAAFDNMLARSIPQYDVMRRAVFDIGSGFVRRDTWVVDLGCSRGEALAPFVDKFGAHVRFKGIEISDPMVEAARNRFDGYIKAGVVEIEKFDLRTGYPGVFASLTLAVLTIQFTPIEYRQRIIQDIYRTNAPGGAFILVEKVLGADSVTNDLMVKTYHAMKAEHGYSKDDIDRKRLSLEGVLVPITADWNEQLLRTAGFHSVDCFWRWMNFAGWVAVK